MQLAISKELSLSNILLFHHEDDNDLSDKVKTALNKIGYTNIPSRSYKKLKYEPERFKNYYCIYIFSGKTIDMFGFIKNNEYKNSKFGFEYCLYFGINQATQLKGEAPAPGMWTDGRLDADFKTIVNNLNKIIRQFQNNKLIDDLLPQNAKAREEKKVTITGYDAIILPIIEDLKSKSENLKRKGHFYFLGGLAALLVSAVIIFFYIHSIKLNVNTNINEMIKIVVLNTLLIGLLVAIAKYCFILGKSYTNESFNNESKIHAIRYGEFYLKATESFNWNEVKEAFQGWNITYKSSFDTISGKEVDPIMINKLLDIINTLTSSHKMKS